MIDKRLQVSPIAHDHQLAHGSPQIERGLQILHDLEFATIAPTAIIVYNGQLMLIEDAAYRYEWQRELGYWDPGQSRIFALHSFSLDDHKYLDSTTYELGPGGGYILDRRYSIVERHLIVREIYQRRSSSLSANTIYEAEHIFSLDGRFVTTLTEDSVLRESYRQASMDAKGIDVWDDRYKIHGAIASKLLATFYPAEVNALSNDHIAYGKAEESLPFLNTRELFTQLLENPESSHINLGVLPKDQLETYRQYLYPDHTFWDVSPDGLVTAYRGDFCVEEYFGELLFDDESDVEFDEDDIETEPQIYFYGNQIEGDSEVLIECVNESEPQFPRFFSYCWIEDDWIQVIHDLKPDQKIEELNKDGLVEFTCGDILRNSVIHHGVLYMICDEMKGKTPVVLALNVHTLLTSPVFPTVPKNKSIVTVPLARGLSQNSETP